MAIGKEFGKKQKKGDEGGWGGGTHTIKALYGGCELMTLHSFEK
jgi:hypothetical protein